MSELWKLAPMFIDPDQIAALMRRSKREPFFMEPANEVILVPPPPLTGKELAHGFLVDVAQRLNSLATAGGRNATIAPHDVAMVAHRIEGFLAANGVSAQAKT